MRRSLVPFVRRSCSRMLAVAVVSAVTAAGAVAQAAPRVEVVRRDAARRVDVLVDGQPFTSYIWPTTIKKPVLFPLRTAGGVIVTRGFPARPPERTDHPHQVGLWLTYENVNGFDFWNNSDAIPAARRPRMGTIVHKAIRGTTSGRGEGTLDVTEDWVDGAGKTLLREDTRYVFHAAKELRSIDRITTLTALDTTVWFHDAKDGMLGMRVTHALEQPTEKPEVFRDASGQATTVAASNGGVTGHYISSEGLGGDSVWSTRGRWTMLSGTVQNEPVTIAILDHPKNVGFPTIWHARGYGLFAANPLGPAAFHKDATPLEFHLAPGQSTTFRYRILILDRQTTPADIERAYEAWVR